MSQITGTVRWFNPRKGYGFLGRDGGADVFVHYTAIQSGDFRSMREGEPVSFDITHDVHGPQATQVRRLDRTSHPGLDLPGVDLREPADRPGT